MILTDADELRVALLGAEAALVAEREHSARLQREAEERHGELQAEVGRLSRLVREMALSVSRLDLLAYETDNDEVMLSLDSWDELVRRAEAVMNGATPLVTEGEP